MASGQITMRKVDGWQALGEKSFLNDTRRYRAAGKVFWQLRIVA
jgi:hypothetical protein